MMVILQVGLFCLLLSHHFSLVSFSCLVVMVQMPRTVLNGSDNEHPFLVSDVVLF